MNSCLSDCLASLAIVRAMPDLRMLPAHGPVRETTHDRIDELLAHHEERLKASHEAIVGGAQTAYEVAVALPWTRRATASDDLRFVQAHARGQRERAHLDVLVRRDDLAVTEDPDGDVDVRRYIA